MASNKLRAVHNCRVYLLPVNMEEIFWCEKHSELKREPSFRRRFSLNTDQRHTSLYFLTPINENQEDLFIELPEILILAYIYLVLRWKIDKVRLPNL